MFEINSLYQLSTVFTTALQLNYLEKCSFFSESLNFAHYSSVSAERGCKKRAVQICVFIGLCSYFAEMGVACCL